MSQQTESNTASRGAAGPSDDVSYRYEKRGFLIALVVCALLTAGAFLNVEYRGHRWVTSFIFLAPLILITFALTLAVLADSTTLIVGRAGIIIPTLSKSRIPWSDISNVRAVDENSLQMIHFEIENKDRYVVPSANPLKRILSAFDEHPESVYTKRLNAPREQIMAVIAGFRTQASEGSSSRR